MSVVLNRHVPIGRMKCMIRLCRAPILSLTSTSSVQVFYLALVQILDVRGGEMLPPPPEALNIDCIDCSLLLRR